MKKINVKLILLAILIIAVPLLFANTLNLSAPATEESMTDLARAAEDNESFNQMMDVLTHKRCMNCHPSGDRPRQGEDSHIHNFGVMRGPDDKGLAALKCESCHQTSNNLYSGVPGAPHWGLAPVSMAWEGLSRVEIARSMMNPKNNGGKNLEEIVKHLTEDKLVLWAWEPGVDDEGFPREKPPVSKEDFIIAVKAWAAAGAKIPNE